MRHILACDHVCVRACDTHFCYQTGFQTLQNNSSVFPDLENIIQEGLRTRLIARASFSERFWKIQKKMKFYKNFHLTLLTTESELQSESGAALLGIFCAFVAFGLIAVLAVMKGSAQDIPKNFVEIRKNF